MNITYRIQDLLALDLVWLDEERCFLERLLMNEDLETRAVLRINARLAAVDHRVEQIRNLLACMRTSWLSKGRWTDAN